MRIVLVVLALLVSIPSAWAEKRFALLIGNGNYTHVNALPNVENDIKGLSKTFADLGFIVDARRDLDGAAMERAIAEFSKNAKGADIVAFYYAGHGANSKGDDFLLATGFNPEDSNAGNAEALSIGQVVSILSASGAATLAFIDASRQSLEDVSSVKLSEAQVLRSGRKGSYLAFSTAPGNPAFDGEGENSPFAAALIAHLPTKAVALEKVMFSVRRDVFKLSKGKQRTFDTSSLKAPVILNP